MALARRGARASRMDSALHCPIPYRRACFVHDRESPGDHGLERTARLFEGADATIAWILREFSSTVSPTGARGPDRPRWIIVNRPAEVVQLSFNSDSTLQVCFTGASFLGKVVLSLVETPLSILVLGRQDQRRIICRLELLEVSVADLISADCQSSAHISGVSLSRLSKEVYIHSLVIKSEHRKNPGGTLEDPPALCLHQVKQSLLIRMTRLGRQHDSGTALA